MSIECKDGHISMRGTLEEILTETSKILQVLHTNLEKEKDKRYADFMLAEVGRVAVAKTPEDFEAMYNSLEQRLEEVFGDEV